MPRVLIIDNYDSFTYNLVQYMGELGAEVEVVRNDKATVDELIERKPERVVVSPGPCTPNEAGISMEAIERFGELRVPVLGVCLGHQSIGQVYGGSVIRNEPIHGKTMDVTHDGKTIFEGLSNPLQVGRYHSLVVAKDDLPSVLEVSAEGEGLIMALRHKELPVEGVQFHPESIMTIEGMGMLDNFLRGAE
ncbi:MAG: aminodeoxychorismate/anthranilate synthase component II [Actinobacteria bacterium]|nr:aminodeoxychorismate/anthranilate synthase component II [Actinomycetota bacterium]